MVCIQAVSGSTVTVVRFKVTDRYCVQTYPHITFCYRPSIWAFNSRLIVFGNLKKILIPYQSRATHRRFYNKLKLTKHFPVNYINMFNNNKWYWFNQRKLKHL